MAAYASLSAAQLVDIFLENYKLHRSDEGRKLLQVRDYPTPKEVDWAAKLLYKKIHPDKGNFQRFLDGLSIWPDEQARGGVTLHM